MYNYHGECEHNVFLLCLWDIIQTVKNGSLINATCRYMIKDTFTIHSFHVTTLLNIAIGETSWAIASSHSLNYLDYFHFFNCFHFLTIFTSLTVFNSFTFFTSVTIITSLIIIISLTFITSFTILALVGNLIMRWPTWKLTRWPAWWLNLQPIQVTWRPNYNNQRSYNSHRSESSQRIENS